MHIQSKANMDYSWNYYIPVKTGLSLPMLRNNIQTFGLIKLSSLSNFQAHQAI